MRILILSNFGMGLYKFRKELIEVLLCQEIEVWLSFPYDEYADLLKELGCGYIDTQIERRGTNPLTDFKLFLHYISLIRKIKPNVVLAYTIKPNIYGGMACRLMKIPFIANITGLGSAIENVGFTQKLTLRLYSIGLRRAQCVFFQNETNRNVFINQKLVKVKTMRLPGSGVNLTQHIYEEYPAESTIIRFLFVGRIMKEKGIDELLQAAEQVKSIYPEVQFDLIGFYEESYSDQINECARKHIINYYGKQEEVNTFLKRAHAILLPSYHEGMANVLLEGAATGRPVLASRIPGCREAYDEGISGLGFEVKNVESLVEAILRFIELPYEKRRAMGLSGRMKMEQEFDRSIVVNAYMEEIRQVTLS